MAQYYVGLKVGPSHHVTLAFLGKINYSSFNDIIAKIELATKECPLPVKLILGESAMFGYKKNVEVRLCDFDETAKVIQKLAEELYKEYATKDYSQSFHITFTNTIHDQLIRNQSEAMGTMIYIKEVGKNRSIYQSSYD